jgi:dCMP deaminase
VGYNGPPRGCDPHELEVYGVVDDWSRESKNSVTIHAEVNAILNSAVDIAGWALFITEPPCLQCACAIVQKQLAEVHFPELDKSSKWWDQQYRAVSLLQAVRITVITYNKYGVANGNCT